LYPDNSLVAGYEYFDKYQIMVYFSYQKFGLSWSKDMFERNVFTVHPSGRMFETSLMCEWIPFMGGDRSGAFGRAHRHAAQYAASNRVNTYVTRNDTGGYHTGFSSRALTNPSPENVLLNIINSGVGAYWDFAMREWCPLPAEEVEERAEKSVRA